LIAFCGHFGKCCGYVAALEEDRGYQSLWSWNFLNSIIIIPIIISNYGIIYKQTTALMEEVGIKVDCDETIR